MAVIPCRVVVVPRTGNFFYRDLLAPTRKEAELTVWIEESRRHDIIGAIGFDLKEPVTP